MCQRCAREKQGLGRVLMGLMKKEEECQKRGPSSIIYLQALCAELAQSTNFCRPITAALAFSPLMLHVTCFDSSLLQRHHHLPHHTHHQQQQRWDYQFGRSHHRVRTNGGGRRGSSGGWCSGREFFAWECTWISCGRVGRRSQQRRWRRLRDAARSWLAWRALITCR